MIRRDDRAGRQLPSDRRIAHTILMATVIFLGCVNQPVRANPPDAAYLLVLREAIKLPPDPLRTFLLHHHDQLRREVSAQLLADDASLPTSLACRAFRVAPSTEITESPAPARNPLTMTNSS